MKSESIEKKRKKLNSLDSLLVGKQTQSKDIKQK